MDTDKMLCQCPACDFKQEFNWLQYNKNGECIECNKCHTHYDLRSVNCVVWSRSRLYRHCERFSS